MSHNPNPFDFVPFADEDPMLKTPEEWLKLGNLRTGRITVQMKALAPVHIVGEQPMEKINGKEGKNIEKSFFYQRNGKHYIPGSSIRGVLRGFIEAACNGWASQLTPYYEKKETKHAIGFTVVESETDNTIDIDRNLPSAINQKFTVPSSAEKGIDLASFLFGYIPGKQDDNDQFNPAWKGRIIIDDAGFDGSMLSSVTTDDSYRIPDLDNNNSKPNDKDKYPRAFMGGPHPSASSWWYQYPYTIKKEKKETFTVYKFIGSGLRGRKFYFHQSPVICVNYYNAYWNKTIDGKKSLYFFPIECIKPDQKICIDIFFNDIPESLLSVIIFALEPGKNIRHKIGYGKAYGYGSIEFSVKDIAFKSKSLDDSEGISLAKIRTAIARQITTDDKETAQSITNFLHIPSLEYLTFILWYDTNILFTYPSRNKDGFNHTMQKNDRRLFSDKIKAFLSNLKIEPNKALTKDQYLDISKQLYSIKPALNFTLYQEGSHKGSYIIQKKQRLLKLNF